MEYYSAIKRNEIELFVVRWMDVKSVIQREVSQKEKNKYRMLTHIYGILKKKKSICGTNPTEHLVNSGRRPQTSQKLCG